MIMLNSATAAENCAGVVRNGSLWTNMSARDGIILFEMVGRVLKLGRKGGTLLYWMLEARQ